MASGSEYVERAVCTSGKLAPTAITAALPHHGPTVMATISPIASRPSAVISGACHQIVVGPPNQSPSE